MESRGHRVAVFNRTTARVDEFIAGRGAGRISWRSLAQGARRRDKKPRKVMIMVKAGAAVDAVLNELVPLLEAGDVVIDGGNTTIPTPSAARRRYARRGSTSWAPASRAAKRARSPDLRSCPVARAKVGPR